MTEGPSDLPSENRASSGGLYLAVAAGILLVSSLIMALEGDFWPFYLASGVSASAGCFRATQADHRMKRIWGAGLTGVSLVLLILDLRVAISG